MSLYLYQQNISSLVSHVLSAVLSNLPEVLFMQRGTCASNMCLKSNQKFAQCHAYAFCSGLNPHACKCLTFIPLRRYTSRSAVSNMTPVM